MLDKEIEEAVERGNAALKQLREQCDNNFGTVMITLETMVVTALIERYSIEAGKYCLKFGEMCADVAPSMLMLKIIEEIESDGRPGKD